jgi:hypothetical protein
MVEVRKASSQQHGPGVSRWSSRWDDDGIVFAPDATAANPELTGYVNQLVDDGFAIQDGEAVRVRWDSFFEAVGSPGYSLLSVACGLPGSTSMQLCLGSRDSLVDASFSIFIAGWRLAGGARVHCEAVGPVLRRGQQSELMRAEQWQAYVAVIEFASRPAEKRSERHNRSSWARIRSLALAAEADLDDFLGRCVVLSPEKLRIELRRSNAVQEDKVIEVVPTFEGAPEQWLSSFDAGPVRERYDLATSEGIVQILIAPQVQAVLQEIKSFPLRRVAGSRAQAFIVNPYAALGESAAAVIDEKDFERARDVAGLNYERFVPVMERSASGRPERIGLLIETADSTGPLSSRTVWLADSQIEEFIRIARRSLERGFQLIAWDGFDLEVQGDLQRHLDELKAALDERRAPVVLVKRAEIYDLAAYSGRVSEIGVEQRYCSPYIAKLREDEGWFPDNIQPCLLYPSTAGSEPISVSLSRDLLEQLESAVASAERRGDAKVDVSWLPEPIPVSEAREAVKSLGEAIDAVKKGVDDPLPLERARERCRAQKKSPVVRPNISSLDYLEERRAALRSDGASPSLPASLSASVMLKQHQLDGVAWLQHLYAQRETLNVRGAVLADDMGLGKTLQLLCMLLRLMEDHAHLDPILVVAPVALLENWLAELQKFFTGEKPRVLVAYGSRLSELRVPSAAIDARLREEDGLSNFLKPGWIGDHRVVLTTYETLRDLEFSFARARWSVMVCDEAQRIKNPAALVTRAAKKLNVGFRIACTGTPVENTLADLWCLFDFVQPGLLGALSDFGTNYRRPIEAKSDEQRARVEQLRELIAPQILRRTKAEVARDLPAKIVDSTCKTLQLSPTQRQLYASALTEFVNKGREGRATFKNHLGLLHYLRRVCSDPRPDALRVFVPEPLERYKAKSPKLSWLIEQLGVISSRGEKAIIFCEFREMQRLLQHYIAVALRYQCDIVNGDTTAEATSPQSRQKRLQAFQQAPGFGAIILSPLAVGFGLNIQAANHVIHFTRTWNPAKEDQATDRAYRIGQTKDVTVYYPTVVSNEFATFEVVLDKLLERKRELAQDMLNGSADVSAREFEFDGVQLEPAPIIDDRVTADITLQMDWQHFEALVALLWSKMGFACYPTPAVGDSGVDVVALRGTNGVLVQAKTARVGSPGLSWDAVKEVVAGAAVYEAKHPGVTFERVCVANHFFGQQARDTAAVNNVRLIDRHGLGELLSEYPVYLAELSNAEMRGD